MRSGFAILVCALIVTSANHGLANVDLKEFDHLDPQHIVPDTPLERAMMYFKKNRAFFKNQKYVGVIDYTKKASQKRFYIINLKSGKVEAHAVAHGSGSDPSHTGKAKKFSNSGGSNSTSIGFYRTGEVYSGKHGKSLRLDGLSKTNSNARDRAVVIHGAWYVKESGGGAIGRSWGCPAVDQKVRDEVIEKLRDGAMLYAFGGQGSEKK